MAYANGSATSFADLLAAVQAACTANGWTLTGNVLSKGTCFVQLSVVGSALDVLGGTGISGSALTGDCGYSAQLRAIAANAIVFPVAYEIHINTAPDEVYLVVNYNVTRYGWLAFGQSPVGGLPGTGNWYGAICSANNGIAGIAIDPVGLSTSLSANYTCAAIGFAVGVIGSGSPLIEGQNFRIHHGLDGNAWSSDTGSTRAITATPLAPLLSREPSIWNSESPMLPLQVYVSRPSSKVSMVGDFGHARQMRIDNYSPGDIIMLGTDKWKVYPWHMKNTTARDGGLGIDHTGTLGWAVRYTGP